MKLGEFITQFSHNNIIRLVYKDGEGYTTVGNDWNFIEMDWTVNKQRGVFRHYINNEVKGLVGIHTGGQFPETINIIIEKLDDQPFIEEIIETKTNCEAF